MKIKIRGYLSIILMSLLFFCMADTKYAPAIGDLVLEAFGVRSWSGEHTGTHMTVLYFGILFLLCLFAVRKYGIDELKLNGRHVFLIFILLVTSFTYITGFTAQSLKRNSEGLQAIAFNSKDSIIEYQFRNGNLVDLKIEFELRNYGDQTLTFTANIDSSWLREDRFEPVSILSKDGTNAVFKLRPGETKKFNLGFQDYIISGGRVMVDGSSSGNISELVLSEINGDGHKIRLNSRDIMGIILGR